MNLSTKNQCEKCTITDMNIREKTIEKIIEIDECPNCDSDEFEVVEVSFKPRVRYQIVCKKCETVLFDSQQEVKDKCTQ